MTPNEFEATPGRPDPATQQLQGVPADAVFPPADDEVHLSRDEQATVAALHPGTALLIVLRGPNSGALSLIHI